LHGLEFEKLYDGAQCRIIAVSFHCNVRHSHAKEGHCQASLQQRQAQRPKQCILVGLPHSHGRALAGDRPQD